MMPFVIFFLVFIGGPAAFFSLGVWVGRGMPGLPFAVHIERRRQQQSVDWEP